MYNLIVKQTEQQVINHFNDLSIDGVGYETTTPKVVWYRPTPVTPDITVTAELRLYDYGQDDELFSFTYPNGYTKRYYGRDVYDENKLDVDLVNDSTFNSNNNIRLLIAFGTGPGATSTPFEDFRDGDTFTLPGTTSDSYYTVIDRN